MESELAIPDGGSGEHPSANFDLERRLEAYQAVMDNNYNLILSPDPEIEEFLDNDSFWKSISDDREIPLKWAMEKDPTFPIVGKEREILIGKLAILKSAKLEAQRRARFADLSMLLTEIEYLKSTRIGSEIMRWEKNLKKYGGYDWEIAYQTILKGLDQNTTLKVLEPKDPNYHNLARIVRNRGRTINREDIIEKIELNRSEIDFNIKINESLITEKIREEFQTPVTYFLFGPMGSGKSFIQRRLEVWRQELYNHLDLKGYDRLMLRDQKERDSAYLRTFLGGSGASVIEYHESIEIRKERFNRTRNWLIYSSLFAFPVYAATVLTARIAQFSWGVDIGVDPAIDLGAALNRNFNWIALGLGLAGWNAIYNRLVKRWEKGESNRPEWIVNSTQSTPVIIGNVDREEIVGKYLADAGSDVQPQKKFTKPNWLNSDGQSLIIEQLADLSEENQNILAQIIQEKEFPITDKGEYTTSYFSFMSIGLNPHLADKVVAPLKDRLKLGYGSMVANEIPSTNKIGTSIYDSFIEQALQEDPNNLELFANSESTIERSKRIERKFWGFMKYFRKDNKPFNREALEKAVDLSSALSEDKSKLVIDREFIGILTHAMTLSTLRKEDFTTADDILNSAKTYRSDEQSTLLPVLERHYKSMEQGLKFGVGYVNVLGLLLYNTGNLDNEHLIYIAEKNSLGYIFPIQATAEKSGQGGSLEIITNEQLSSSKEFYEQELKLLLKNRDIKISNYDLSIDISKSLCNDDSILSAMYVAVKSAIDGKEIDGDKVLLAKCDHYGNLLSPKRSNKRLITAHGRLDKIIVSEYDLSKKIDSDIYLEDFGINLLGVNNLDELYGALKNEAH